MDLLKTWSCEPHQMTAEAPDLVMIRLHGQVSLEDSQKFIAGIHEFSLEQPVYYVLVDLADGGGWSPEARKNMSNLPPNSERSAMSVMVGGSFAVRSMMNMVLRALALMRKESSTSRFVATESEARELIAQHRARRGITAEPG